MNSAHWILAPPGLHELLEWEKELDLKSGECFLDKEGDATLPKRGHEHLLLHRLYFNLAILDYI